LPVQLPTNPQFLAHPNEPVLQGGLKSKPLTKVSLSLI